MPVGAKFGGRTKGTPNKSTQDLHALAEELECDPFKVLLHFAKGDYESLGYAQYQQRVTKTGEVVDELTIPPELRQKSAKDACEYLHAKRKAIEHTGANGEELFSYEKYLKSLEDKK